MDDNKLNLGELEKQIVAAAIADREFFISCYSILEPSVFSNEMMAKTWKLLQSYFAKYASVPPIAVITKLMSQVMKDVTDFDAETYRKDIIAYDINAKDWLRDEVIRITKQQKLSAFILKAADTISNPKGTPIDYDKLSSELSKIVQISPDVNLGTDYFDAKTRYAKVLAVSENRISTGFPTLDKYLGGGFAPKELYCWAAPAGLGKSLWLVNLGKNMLMQGLNVLHYTLEMSEERIGLRYDCSMLNTDTKSLITNWEESIRRVEDRRKLIKTNVMIKEYPTRSANTNHFRAHIQKLREYKSFVPDVIMVDYGDIMKSMNKYDNEYDEQGAIFEELRAISQELNIPVVTATQTNRESLDKAIITNRNIGDSFRKVRIVDFLATINEKPEEKELGIQKLFIAKNRNNIDGVVLGFKVSKQNMQIIDMGEVEDAPKVE